MAYFDDDFNEEVFEAIPCEFCKHLFPFEDIVIHETGCEYDLVRVVETPAGEHFAAQEKKVEVPKKNALEIANEEMLKLEEDVFKFLEAPLEKKNISVPKEKTPVINEVPPIKKEIPPVEKKMPTKKPTINDFQEFEVLEDHLQENEPFSFASGKNKEKKVEKETPSFKNPLNPNFSNNDVKCLIQNDLPESDNEENESLEKFWKRAEIKLAQRLREMEKKKQTYMA